MGAAGCSWHVMQQRCWGCRGTDPVQLQPVKQVAETEELQWHCSWKATADKIWSLKTVAGWMQQTRATGLKWGTCLCNTADPAGHSGGGSGTEPGAWSLGVQQGLDAGLRAPPKLRESLRIPQCKYYIASVPTCSFICCWRIFTTGCLFYCLLRLL